MSEYIKQLLFLHIFILGGKGGIGKDLLAEAAYLAALMSGLEPLLVEIEAARRLGVIYPETKSILVDALTPEAIYANPDITFAPFDEAAKIWSGDQMSVSCFGANLTQALVVWANASGAALLHEGEHLVLAVVLTMNHAALAGGLTELYELGQTFPKARRVAILNDIHASFIDGDQHLARRLEEARGDGMPIETIRIARCNAPTWGYLQASAGGLREIAEMDPQKLIDLGLPQGPVLRSRSLVTSWIADGLIKPMTTLLPSVPNQRRQPK